MFGGGPLELPPYEAAYTPLTVAVFLVLWLTLIVMLLVAEDYHPER